MKGNVIALALCAGVLSACVTDGPNQDPTGRSLGQAKVEQIHIDDARLRYPRDVEVEWVKRIRLESGRSVEDAKIRGRGVEGVIRSEWLPGHGWWPSIPEPAQLERPLHIAPGFQRMQSGGIVYGRIPDEQGGGFCMAAAKAHGAVRGRGREISTRGRFCQAGAVDDLLGAGRSIINDIKVR